MSMSPAEFAAAFSAGLLAFTLIASGASKAGRTSGTLASMMTLRVPEPLQRRWVAGLVPVWEIGLAAALLVAPGPFRALAGGAAVLTMLVFTVLIAGVLRRGEEADCGCFGPFAATDRVTGWTLARNIVLVLAAVLATAGTWSAPALLQVLVRGDALSLVSLCLGWVLVAVLVLLRTRTVLRRELRRAPRAMSGAGALSPAAHAPGATASETGTRGAEPGARAAASGGSVDSSGGDGGAGGAASGGEGAGGDAAGLGEPDGWEPPPLSPASIALGLDPARPGEVRMGERIPRSELVSATGITQELPDLGDGRPTLLLFLSTSCGNCHPVAERAAGWAEELAPLQLRVATSSTPREMERMFPALLPYTRYGAASALSRLGVQRSPAAVLLGGREQPVIASPLAYGLQEIEGLVEAVSGAR